MKTIIEIMEDQDWEITISIDNETTPSKKSILIEGDTRSFKMLANILLNMAKVVKEQPHKNTTLQNNDKSKTKGYGVVIAPEENSQIIMPDLESLILECSPRKPKKKKGKK